MTLEVVGNLLLYQRVDLASPEVLDLHFLVRTPGFVILLLQLLGLHERGLEQLAERMTLSKVTVGNAKGKDVELQTLLLQTQVLHFSTSVVVGRRYCL